MVDVMKTTTDEIYEFIEETLEKSESVLVHSVRGQSRASAVIAIYLMKKYRWTLLKTLEFLNSRRPDLEIRASFIHQLNMFENYLSKSGFGPKTQDWNEISEKSFYMENEELLLRNTFLNSKMGPLAEYNAKQNAATKKRKIKTKICWADEKRIPLAQEGRDEDDLVNKFHVDQVIIHHQVEQSHLKSSMKGNGTPAFGPKYTGEGQIDFYRQSDVSGTDLKKEDVSDLDPDI